jgi:hypothetical protein
MDAPSDTDKPGMGEAFAQLLAVSSLGGLVRIMSAGEEATSHRLPWIQVDW